MSLTKEKYVFTSSEIEAIKKEIYKELGVCRVNYWTTRVAILIALDTGMRPQEIQALKWHQIIDDGKFKVFKINDSWSEKEKHLNDHLKSRPRGESRLTLPLSEPLLQLLEKFHHHQLEFLKENKLTNSND
ncbi:tyrosine-type recombinase/integrase, partial [Lactobacillus acidophilus]|uniref:tyrosine-type recombinase/integrase n=1 Tax=Lactobacillus acidophilus TaxID=1579 RepID=UPI003F5377E6